jgi:hypothetical protein
MQALRYLYLNPNHQTTPEILFDLRSHSVKLSSNEEIESLKKGKYMTQRIITSIILGLLPIMIGASEPYPSQSNADLVRPTRHSFYASGSIPQVPQPPMPSSHMSVQYAYHTPPIISSLRPYSSSSSSSLVAPSGAPFDMPRATQDQLKRSDMNRTSDRSSSDAQPASIPSSRSAFRAPPGFEHIHPQAPEKPHQESRGVQTDPQPYSQPDFIQLNALLLNIRDERRRNEYEIKTQLNQLILAVDYIRTMQNSSDHQPRPQSPESWRSESKKLQSAEEFTSFRQGKTHQTFSARGRLKKK